KTDLVARFGGEEFVALLPGTDAEQANYLAEKVRRAIESHLFTTGTEGVMLRCTISVGVAVSPEDAIDPITLMQQADAAVYRAKRTRNAVARPSSGLDAAAPEASAESAVSGRADETQPRPK